jgi:hypothetical protein
MVLENSVLRSAAVISFSSWSYRWAKQMHKPDTLRTLTSDLRLVDGGPQPSALSILLISRTA